jgi:hypothetical protein
MSGSNASGAILGPMSTSKTPLIMRPHNSGILYGQHPNPPQYYPSSSSTDFANARHVYARSFSKSLNVASDIPTSNVYVAGIQKTVHTTQATSYIPPKTSYDHMLKLKSINIGKSSYKQNLPDTYALSYKVPDSNEARRRLRMNRSAGTVAPRKKYRNYL